MNQKEITLLISYILNNRTRLESELDKRQSNIRMREFTLTDCVECAYSSVYLEVFNQVTTDILHLLSLYPDDKKTGE